MSVALNLAVLLILAFCVWQGYKKGLIMSICSIVIVFISAYAAGQIARQYAGDATEIMAPVLDWLPDIKIDEAVDEVAGGLGPISQITDETVLGDIADVAFEKIGITGAFKEILTEKALGELSGDVTIRQAIADNFLYGVSYLLLCVFAFIVTLILLTLLIHFISAMFKLPDFKLVDKIGGGVLGLVFGMFVLVFFGWALQFIGVFLPAESFTGSGLLRGFMNMGWLNGLLNFKP
ncbi:MAG: hypothetical protein LBR85_01680 [Oscillospiraceae bacterium]|jgi:uncharacterized membrane protein required for colicin V production|nr:hypothetical protein [Oscillospiraceae bacterium]